MMNKVPIPSVQSAAPGRAHFQDGDCADKTWETGLTAFQPPSPRKGRREKGEKYRQGKICQYKRPTKPVKDSLVGMLSHRIFNLRFEIGKYRLSISHKRLHPFRHKGQSIAMAEKVSEGKVPFQIV